MTHEQQIEFWHTNLSVAIAFMQELPDEAVDLSAWVQRPGSEAAEKARHTCGSVGCLGGWLPHIPYFERLGVTADELDGSPIVEVEVEGEKDKLYAVELVARHLFGAGWRLFARADEAIANRLTDQTGRSDRKIAIDRLQYCLSQLEANPTTYGTPHWEGY